MIWFVILSLLAWGVARWIIGAGRDTAPQVVAQRVSPLEILEQRYARGEIDAATFQRMRAELEATLPPERP
jgi:uncharacterized membrane protein